MDTRSSPIVIMNFQKNPELIESFKGIREAIEKASNVKTEDLHALRIDDTIALSGDSGSGLKCLSEEILSRIRNAPYVVCDTTDNRPNVYFELGYAVAHNKTIFLIHRVNTEPPHFDIRNKSIIYYYGGLDLRDKLTDSITLYLRNKKTGGKSYLSDFFQRCEIPIIPLEGDGTYRYELRTQGTSPVRINLVNRDYYRPPAKWAELFSDVSKQQLDFANKNGIVFFNGNLLRVVDFVPERNEKLRTRSLRIDVQPTDYFTFCGSNHCWDWINPTTAQELRLHENSVTQNLRESVLANALSVNISIVCTHEHKDYIVFQERNAKKVFHCRQKFSCAAGGMTSFDRDNRAFGPDLYSTAKNEVQEELGCKITDSAIIFRALVRDTVNFEIAMIGEICLSGNPNELLNPSADRFEFNSLRTCRLTPKDVFRFINDNGGFQSFTPMCLGSFVFTLLGRYSPEDIERVFRENMSNGAT